jgi:Protein of unknown function (DUF1428)
MTIILTNLMKKDTARYVDGFVLAIPKGKINAYVRLARMCGKIWLEHGALEYRECVGDDLQVKMGIPFPQMVKIKPKETVISVTNLACCMLFFKRLNSLITTNYIIQQNLILNV